MSWDWLALALWCGLVAALGVAAILGGRFAARLLLRASDARRER